MKRLTRGLLTAVLCLAACGDESSSNNSNNGIDIDADAGVADTGGENNAAAPTYSFEGEVVECEVNEKYQARQAVLAGGKNNPTGRGEQGGVWDPCNERVIVFGGNDKQPAQCDSFGPKNYLGDTWAYAMEFDNWYRINLEDAPEPRGRHTSAFDLSRKKVYIFGGRFRPEGQDMGNYTMYDDLWAFDVNADTWAEVQTTGDKPAARTNAQMVYDDLNDRLILFGGNTSADGLAFRPLNETHILDLDSMEWSQVATSSSVPARLFHAMVLDGANNQLLSFSGGDENAFFGPFYQDVWALDLDALTWSKVWDSNVSVGPTGRINAAFVEHRESGSVYMFGGHDDTALGNDNDLWAFSGATGMWREIQRGDTYTGSGCTSFCSCPDNFVEYDFDAPERRQYQTFVRAGSMDRAIMFGGTGDCGYLDDTWYLDLETETWEEVQPAEQGIACERTGRDNCEELCF
jgi:N-acetylneuraminic acid mutarotase